MDTTLGVAVMAIVVIAVIVLGYAAIKSGTFKEIQFGEGKLGFRIKAKEPLAKPPGAQFTDVRVQKDSGIDAPAGAPLDVERTEVKDNSHITIH